MGASPLLKEKVADGTHHYKLLEDLPSEKRELRWTTPANLRAISPTHHTWCRKLHRSPPGENATVDLGLYEYFVAYTVTAWVISSEGSITPEKQIVTGGETASFTVTPDPDWSVGEVIGDSCTPVPASGGAWEATKIQADCTVTVSFSDEPEDDEVFVDRFEAADQ